MAHILGTGHLDPEKETAPLLGSTKQAPFRMAEEADEIQPGASVRGQQEKG